MSIKLRTKQAVGSPLSSGGGRHQNGFLLRVPFVGRRLALHLVNFELHESWHAGSLWIGAEWTDRSFPRMRTELLPTDAQGAHSWAAARLSRRLGVPMRTSPWDCHGHTSSQARPTMFRCVASSICAVHGPALIALGRRVERVSSCSESVVESLAAAIAIGSAPPQSRLARSRRARVLVGRRSPDRLCLALAARDRRL